MKISKYFPIILLLMPIMANSASPVICENQDANNPITSIWPSFYILNSGDICFDVKDWPEFSGTNCISDGKNAHWTGTVIVTEDGNSLGRDLTNFRILNPIVTDEQIQYVIEWSRDDKWLPMQNIKINRITGLAVSYFVTMHGGESYLCHLGKKAL